MLLTTARIISVDPHGPNKPKNRYRTDHDAMAGSSGEPSRESSVADGQTVKHKKVRSFRIGMLRESKTNPQVKTVASVGIASDGGIFVTPFPKGAKWKYGNVRTVDTDFNSIVTTDQNPKLHYHRSGFVSVSLTGQSLERRSIKLAPIQDQTPLQIFSIISVRPWELPTTPIAQVRRGAFISRTPKWPAVASWQLTVVPSNEETLQKLLIPNEGERGLLMLGSSTHGIVSLSGYGHEAVVAVSVNLKLNATSLLPIGGTTVAAIPWSTMGPQVGQETLALWSADMRNPVVSFNPHPQVSLEPAEGYHFEQHRIDEIITPTYFGPS